MEISWKCVFEFLWEPCMKLCLGSIGMDCVISESCYNRGTILQRNYRKITIYGHFPIIPL